MESRFFPVQFVEPLNKKEEMNIKREVLLGSLNTEQIIQHLKSDEHLGHRDEDIKYIPRHYERLETALDKDIFFNKILLLLTENDHNLSFHVCGALVLLSSVATSNHKNRLMKFLPEVARDGNCHFATRNRLQQVMVELKEVKPGIRL